MSMQPVEVERKIRQLDNDVQSIYGMLASIQATQARQGNRLEEMALRMDEGFEHVTARLNLILSRLEFLPEED